MANSAAVIGAPTVSDVTEDTNLQVLIAAGLISISDANAGQAAFKTTVISASGNLGALTIAANGAYSYSVADSAVQYLGAGDTKIDTFTVTSLDGTTKKVSFTIHGVNDTAVIGNATVHDVTEDATKPNLVATGSISISDVDQNQAAFKTAVISSTGNLGTLTLASNGSYSYSVVNSAVQYLGAGDTKVDTFTVTSLDGTTKQISFTIHGVNDAAVIGTPTMHDVTEDATNPNLTANGMISITDADQGQAAFKTSVISAAGNLGTLTLAANGSYSYSVADSAVQYLGAGDTKVDTFTVTSLDGTTKQVSFTIHGANDAAVIGTPTVHDVTEDATQPLLYALGTISISDADQGQAAFQLGIISGAGALGTLVLLPNGAYAYVVADSAVQYLGANDTKVDTFTIKSVDGTTKQISFTIHGTNDVAVIGNPTVHDVTEDANPTTLTATGSISVSDADQNQSAFQATVVSAAGNLGTLTLAANGSYSYTVANSATQYLGASDTKTDTFTIASVDGTAKQVTFTIHGVNDSAVIGNPTVQDVTADPSKTTLTATGSISITDVDQGQAAFKTSVTSSSGNIGALTIASNGAYSYSVAESKAALLGTNGTKVDTFTVTSLDGTTKQVTFTVHGPGSANHAATIGDPTVHDVTEDTSVTAGNLTAAGSISITDPDAGQAALSTTTTAANGNLGSLVLASNGNYTYTVANSAVQYLGATDTKVDIFTVTSVDGTTKQVSFTIHGTNDAAVISGTSTVNLTETNAVLTTSGTLSATDVDSPNTFVAQPSTAGINGYGHFTIGANGVWTYSTDTAHNEFVNGTTYTDALTVKTADGTSQVLTVNITGTNDAAVITGTSTANLTETNAVLTTGGTLSVTDIDNPNTFVAQTSAPGSNGYGHFNIGTDGVWTYSTDNAHNEFVNGTTYTDTLTVKTADGTSQVLTVNITGTNDAAVITGTSTVNLTETDAVLTTGGTLSATDIDNPNTFVAQTSAPGSNGYGHFNIGTDGVWTYSTDNAHNEFVNGTTYTDTLTVKTADGTSQVLTVNITGTNDAAVITGTSTVNLTETDAVLTTGGTLSATDIDNPNTFVAQTSAPGSNGYGFFKIDANGVWTYTATTAHNEFVNGTTYTDTLTVKTADGTSQVLTVNITGTNDAAVITGTSTANLTETDAVLTTGGTLSVTDIDNPNTFVAQTSAPGSNAYGHFNIGTDGVWTYSTDNAHNEFVGGTTYTDTLTVKTADGTSQVLTVNITGSNDAAVITGTSTVNLTETDAVLTTGGTLSVTDIDNPNTFVAQTSAPGSNGYGHFNIGTDGVWTYSTDNAHNEFVGGTTYTDTLTVKTADGTSQVLTVNITGTNDAAVITGTSTANLTETDAVLTTGGTLSVTDIDNPNTFVAQTSAPGSNGYGHFNIDANGVWTYTATTAHNEFVNGTTYTDTLTVKTADGTSQVLTVNITGSNDAAVITGTSTATLTETNAILTTGGSLSATDVDSATTFTPLSNVAGSNHYGHFSIDSLGAWTYSTDTAHDEFAPGQTYADSFTVTTADGTQKVVTVSILGTQDAPTLSVTTANGFEDNAVSVSISSALVDSGANLTLTVNSVPAGVTFNHGHVDSGDATIWHLSGSDLAGLTLSAGANVSGTINLSVTATSTDIATNSQVTASPQALTVNVVGVADAPNLGADSTTINVAASADPIPLNLHFSLTDLSETGTVTISGIVGNYELSAGTRDDDGNWIVTAGPGQNLADIISTLTMKPTPGNVGDFGAFNLQVTATSADGASVASATAIDVTVNVAKPAGYQSGLATDGYISGATVFADANGNGMLDAGEVSTTTRADGTFTLTGGTGNLVMVGGVDVSTGLDFLGTLSAPNGSSVVTPLTTLVTTLVTTATANLDPQDPGYQDALNAAAVSAQLSVAHAFGLNASIDLQHFDPVSVAAAGGAGAADATKILAAGIQVQTTIAQISAAAGSGTSGADVVSAVASTITAAAGGTVDLTHSETVTSIFQTAAPNADQAAVDAATQIVSASNAAIANVVTTGGDTLTVLSNLAQTATVALGQGTDQLASAAAGTTTFADAVTNNTGSNLTTAIQNAPVGDPDGSQVGTLGNDIISGGGGNDVIDGLDGNDTLSGLGGKDTIHGGIGNDKIFGGDGDDKLYGDDGKDTLTGGAGDDLLDGGNSYDRASYSDATGSVTINLSTHTATGQGVGTDTLVSIESATGSDYADTFIATGFAEVSGVPGASIGQNSFEGKGGDDIIVGTINIQGQKVTRAEYVNATGAVTVDLAAGTADGDNSVGHDTLSNVSGVWGSAFNDTLRGSDNPFGTYEAFEGRGGDDLIDGRGGFDIVTYNTDTTTTAGIVVQMAAGIVTGDATVGTDTLRAVEGVRGTNFDDIYDATNFGNAGTLNIGSSGTFNDFGGAGGNDTVIGNGNTRLNYSLAFAGVTVDLETSAIGTTTAVTVRGIATGTTEGTDTLSGVNAVQGSTFNDTFYGSSFNNTFTGLAGDDYIDGRGGFDIASYNSMGLATAGVTVNLAAGTAVGDASIGTDTLRSIEGIQGTNFADTFNAVGYGNGQAGTLNIGNNGSFNQFEGLGGNDNIIGNGNTRIGYFNAAAGVTVTFTGSGSGTASGTAAGDLAYVGTDTFTGVNSVTGSAFDDTIIGDANSNTLTGGGGNDTIDGGGGADLALYSGMSGQYTINNAGPTTVADGISGRDGTDTLTNVEVLQFTNVNLLIKSGTSGSPIDLSDGRLFFNGTANPLKTLMTSTSNDYVKISQTLSGHQIDLGAGTDDTVILGASGFYSLNLANVEKLIGSAGNDTASFTTNLNGLNVDLGAGTGDFVNLANGANTLSVTNVENVNATDFSGAASNDTLTLSNNVSGLSVNLAQGHNTLNLAAGANSFVGINSVDTINGTASNDTLTVSNGMFTPNGDLTINLGGGDDTVSSGSQFGSFALNGVEHLVVTGQLNASYTLTNDQAGLSVDLGAGNTFLQIATGANTLSLTNVQNVSSSDFVGGSPATDDTLTLLNDVTGLTVSLGQGNNTLNLAAGANAISVFNVQTINGSASSDSLTLSNSSGVTVDLGGGTDTLTLSGGFNSVTVKNVENVIGSTGNDTITIADATGTVTVTGGLGNDFITLGGSHDNVRFTQVADSGTSANTDTVNNFDAANDAFVFDHVGGLVSGIHFVSSGILDGTQSEAILNGNVLEIDVDGDGQIGAGDMAIFLNGLNGTLTDANFVTTGVDHRPTDIQLSGAATVAENSANGTVVGSLSATDPDAGDSATYSLTDSAGGLFAISGSNLVVNGPINYEATHSLQVTVRVTDAGGLSYDKSFAIGITDVNEAPTAVMLSSPAALTAENGGDVKLADITIMDDALGTNTLSLSGADAASFSIVNGANGPELHFNGGANFEVKQVYDVTVNTNDASASNHVTNDASASFHLNIMDVNEAPTVISGATGSVAENAPTSTVVYQALASDPDMLPPNNMITWSLTGADAAAFNIDGIGNVTLKNSANYEAKASYSINVVATDGGALSASKAVTIGIIDVNEAPTAVALNNQVTSTAENGGDVKVADIAVTDDTLGTNVVSLSGADAASFTIVNGNELHFVGGANFEAKTGYDVTVNVNDTTASNHVSPDASQNFHLAITNLNENPTGISLSGNTIGQSTANGTVIGTLSAIDPDAGDTATFSLVNNAGGQFAVSGNTIVVAGTLTSGAQQIIVRDTDAGGLTFDKTLTINVTTGGTFVGDANNNTLTGTAGDDVLQGLAGNDRLQGLAGNDTLDGGTGFDRAVYSDASVGMTFNLASGTVNGIAAGVGTDTLIGIEGIVGTNFADTYDATGFNGDSFTAGTQVGFNEFEGRGGNDSITGAINSQGAPMTRISYVSATGSVTVDLQAGTAVGDSSVGSDTLVGSGFGGVVGSAGNDTLLGSNNGAGTVEVFEGRGGNDLINGRGGFDRADYALDPATTSGITVNMAAGTVVGDRQALGDTTVGSDTLRSVESVRGTNFADSYTATGFTGTSANAGSNGTFNEFNGMGGNDSIIGNGNTRITYLNATGAVTVDIQAGTATGDASTGSDTFSGVNAVFASMFDDTIRGSNNATGTETFYGAAGNDFIDGRGGFDLATYNNIYFSTGPITVNMGAGTVTGDASVGTDTLRSIEAIQGTNFNDVYNATTYGTGTALNIGNNGTFNQFEGLGGNDSITGNGNTRIIYSSATAGVSINMLAGTVTGNASVGTDTFTGVNSVFGSSLGDTYVATGFGGAVQPGGFASFNIFEGLGGNDTITGNGNTRIAFTQAAAGVTVDLSAGTSQGTAAGDTAGVGSDTFTGVNSVQGSSSGDTLTGSSASELFIGGAGNDTINGGAGTDVAVYNGPASAYTMTTVGAQLQVADGTSTRDGTDLLSNVEILQFSDSFLMLTAGTALNPVDISNLSISGNGTPINGTGGDDFLMVGSAAGSPFGHLIDLGAGNDTVMLATGGFYSLNLAHVENLVGSAGVDTVNLVATTNTLSVTGVENVNANDFSGTATNDTLTLTNNVSGLSVNLAQGDNTLNLAAGSNSFGSIFNVQHINGSASDDTLAITNGVFEPGNNPTIDLGAGDNTLHLGGGGTFTLLNVEHLIADGPNSFVTLNNNVTGLSVDLEGVSSNLNLANGANSLSITHVLNIGGSDFSGPASDDTLNLLNDVSGGVSVNLGLGSNTLNLAAGNNSFDNLFNIDHVNGSASNDTLTLNGATANTIDLGDGNDTLNINNGGATLTAVNVENINGSASFENITITNAVTGNTTITAGAGADAITASAGADNFRFISVADSTINGQNDTITNFDATHDTFTFAGITVAGGQIDYVGAGAFEGAGHASAVLQNFGPGNNQLNIDINGDGVMDSADMVVNLTNLQGTLHATNFLLA